MPENENTHHPFFIKDIVNLIASMLPLKDQNNLRLVCRTTEIFLRVNWIKQRHAEQIIAITAAGAVSFFLTASGQVWGCGMELSNDQKVTWGVPQQIIFPEKITIRQVVAG